jgi:UDP-N-acetylmuramate: L-alanyl-gamma-D-glutamyl-meso-diaminopimelate ligase
MVKTISSEARPGDLLLVMSNGAFGGLIDKVLAELKAGA